MNTLRRRNMLRKLSTEPDLLNLTKSVTNNSESPMNEDIKEADTNWIVPHKQTKSIIKIKPKILKNGEEEQDNQYKHFF